MTGSEVTDTEITSEEGARIAGLVGFNALGGSVTDSSASADVEGEDLVGGLIGYSLTGDVSNSHASGTVTATGTDGGNDIGGFIGLNEDTEVTDSTASVDVETGEDYEFVGGFVGTNTPGSDILNSSADGDVETGDESESVGGFAGENFDSITDSSAEGDVDAGSDSESVGGFVGIRGGGQAIQTTNSSAEGDVSAGDDSQFVGGFAGENFDNVVQSSAEGDVSAGDDSRFVGGFAGENSDNVVGSSAEGDVSAGSGSESAGGFAGENTGEIDDSVSEGDVDTGSSDSVGGFVGTNDGEVVLSQSSSNVESDDSVSVGGLAGENTGQVIHSFSVGSVIGLENVGGLVGTNSNSVIKSNSTGSVDGFENVGGLVGNNQDTVSQSTADVEVLTSESSDDPAEKVGGLVGLNDGDVEESYSVGNVEDSGSNNEQEVVGGFVGLNEDFVNESFAAGSVDSTSEFRKDGGLGGLNDGGEIVRSYWDRRTTGQNISVGADSPPEDDVAAEGVNVDGLGETTDEEPGDLDPTDEMTGEDARDNMDELDFDDTWNTVADFYPEHTWEGTNFRVDIAETNAPVNIGEALEVEVEIENDARIPDEQDIEANLPTVGDDDETVALGELETTTEVFEIETSAGDQGEYNLTAESEDHLEEVSVLVGSDFQVVDFETNSPVVEGDTLEIDVKILNRGADDEQTVSAELSDVGQDESDIALGVDESTEQTFEIETEDGDLGNHTLTVETDDDSVSEEVSVSGAVFALTDVETNSPVEEGESLLVNATIENEGTETETQDVVANVSGVGEVTQSVELGGLNSSTETLELETSEGDGGERDLTVETEDDSRTEVVEILGTNFQVEIEDTNTPLVAGETVVADIVIENVGTASDEQEVEFALGNLEEDTRTVELDPSESTEDEFEVPTLLDDAGEYSLTVETEDDSDNVTVAIAEDGVATVSATDANIEEVGEESSSRISFSADEEITSADVDVSIDTDNATISDAEAREVGDTNEIEEITDESAAFSYLNVRGEESATLGDVTFEMTEDVSDEIEIELDADLPDGIVADVEGGTLRLGSEPDEQTFSDPIGEIDGFVGPPTNTQELDDELYEDLSGDGDGTDVSQTVDVFGELIRGEDLVLSPEQAQLLDWDDDSPEDEVTVADMVALFGEQIRAP